MKFYIVQDSTKMALAIIVVSQDFKQLNENNRPHLGWTGFYDSYEALNVNMDNLLHIRSIVCCDRVYVVENPSVFQALLKKCKERKTKRLASMY